MDAFDTIRGAAETLHRAALDSGADRFDPNSLLQRALSNLDLEAAALPLGDPFLRGARALLDWDSGTICYADEGNQADRALLVAHEIGHACVHNAASTCTSDDIDLTRPIEAARVNVQRVEDYGVRERRELQANVFAREFLFPRWLARQLYLEEHMGARAIVARVGLPLNLVRQQLLDALLLPPPPVQIPASRPRPTMRRDPSQDHAARHRGSPYQLQAGPGTGKTGTLVKRVLSLLDDGIDPSNILILTFSNRAAGELSERIGNAVPEASPQMWIGTFHSFGLDLLRRYSDRLNLDAKVPLFDRSDAVELLEDLLPTLDLKHYRNLNDPSLILSDMLQAISRAKDELVDANQYLALCGKMLEQAGQDTEARKAAEKCVEVSHVYQVYESALNKRGAVDFGDLVMRPALLLERDANLRAEVQKRHRYILVDEYQDVNRASARLLQAVAGDGKTVWVVGDARQSIYRFRGASTLNMTLFGSDFPQAKVEQLSINYRSSKEVVDTFVQFASHMSASSGMLDLDLTADRGTSGIGPELRSFEYPDDEEGGVAASVQELQRSGVPLRDQAVLCRSNARLNDLATGLQRRGIPVLYLGSLFEREEIRDLLALLSLAVDRTGSGLVRIASMARYDLSLHDIHSVLRYLDEKSELAPLALRLHALVEAPGLSLEGRAGLERIAQDFSGFSSATIAWDLLTEYLLDRSDLLEQLARRESPLDQIRAVAIWQFLNFLREQVVVGRGYQIQRTLDRVRRLTLLADDRDLRQFPAAAAHIDAVRMMTVHGSKGLEFEVVHIPSLTVAGFPAKRQGQKCPPPSGLVFEAAGAKLGDDPKLAHREEEECLFFVALSRARTHLRLYLHKRQKNGDNRTPSPFLKLLSRPFREMDTAPILELPQGSEEPVTISVTFPNDWQISHQKLGQYERCSLRFFYTHILGIRNARQATAFTRALDCLYDLIRWIASVRPSGNPTLETAMGELEKLWQEKGPVGHAFEADYKRIVINLMIPMLRVDAGLVYLPTEAIIIELPQGDIIVEPEEMATMPNGKILLRIIKAGQRRSDEYKRLEYNVFSIAGLLRYGSQAHLRALFLAEAHEEDVPPAKIAVEELEDILVRIVAGQFPKKTDRGTCPRCPHFFICAANLRGPLTLLTKKS